jgi:hypothetical protein
MACTGNYYINVGGTVQQQCNGILATGLRAAGFVGPFATIADAKARQSVSGATQALASDVAAPVVNATEDALKPLFQSAIWKRVGEVIVGLILLGIGLNALIKSTPLAPVTKAAGAVGKLAMVA